jgi:DNA-binding transcriptional LysR family regulator
LFLIVPLIVPNERLFAVLYEFCRRFPYVLPILRQGTFLSADSELSAQNAHLCVVGLPSFEYYVKPILGIRLLAVARQDHPIHPIHSLHRQPSRIDLIQHTVVTIEGVGTGIARRQPRSPAQRYLSVPTIEAAIAAVRSGLCFGWLPIYRIQPFLDSGELLALRMPIGGTREIRLNMVSKELNPRLRELNALAELLGIYRDLESI